MENSRYERIYTHMANVFCVSSGIVSRAGAALRLCVLTNAHKQKHSNCSE